MTGYERMAYEYGKTYNPDIDEQNAPVFDSRMDRLVIEAQSKQGQEYNHRVISAWWRGRVESGSGAPVWWWKEQEEQK